MPFLNLKHAKAVLSIAILGVFSIAFPARADVMGVTASILSSIAQVIISLVSQILVALIQILLAVTQYNDFINAPAVVKGWVLVRDVSNLAFLVIFIGIAFATILGVEKYEYKRLLPKLLIMAVFINFSRTICGLILDAAQVLMMTFVNGFKDVAAGNLIRGFGLEDMLSLRDQPGGPPPDVTPNTVAAASLLAVVMLIIATITVGVIVVMFLVRILYLWILVLLSPLAFMLSAAPGLSGKFDEWWGKFIKYAFVGPIMAFFLWLSFSIMASVPAGGSLAAENKLSTGNVSERVGATITRIGDSDQLLSYGIAIALLLLSLSIASEMGVKGGKLAEAALGKIRSGAGGLAKFVRASVLTGGLVGAAAYGLAGTKKGRAVADWINRKQALVTGVDLNPRRIMEGMKESFADKKKREETEIRTKAGERFKSKSGFARVVAPFFGDSRDAADIYIKGGKGLKNIWRAFTGGPEAVTNMQDEAMREQVKADIAGKERDMRKEAAKKENHEEEGIGEFVNQEWKGQRSTNETEQAGIIDELKKEGWEQAEKKHQSNWNEQARSLNLDLSGPELKLSPDQLEAQATDAVKEAHDKAAKETDQARAQAVREEGEKKSDKYKKAAVEKREFRTKWEEEKKKEIDAKARDDYELNEYLIDGEGKKVSLRQALAKDIEEGKVAVEYLSEDDVKHFIGKAPEELEKEARENKDPKQSARLAMLADKKRKWLDGEDGWAEKKARADVAQRVKAAQEFKGDWKSKEGEKHKEVLDEVNELGRKKLETEAEEKKEEAKRVAAGGLSAAEIHDREQELKGILDELEQIDRDIKKGEVTGLGLLKLQDRQREAQKRVQNIAAQDQDGKWAVNREANLVQEAERRVEEARQKEQDATKTDTERNEGKRERVKAEEDLKALQEGLKEGGSRLKLSVEAELDAKKFKMMAEAPTWDQAKRAEIQKEIDIYSQESKQHGDTATAARSRAREYAPPRPFYAEQARRALEDEELKKITSKEWTELVADFENAVSEGNQFKAVALMKKLSNDYNDNELFNAFGFASDSQGMGKFIDAVLRGESGITKDSDGSVYTGPGLKMSEQSALAVESDVGYINESRKHWETARTVKVENGIYKRLSLDEHTINTLAEIIKGSSLDVINGFNRLSYGGEVPRADGTGRDHKLAPLGLALLRAFANEFHFRYGRGEYNKNALVVALGPRLDELKGYGLPEEFLKETRGLFNKVLKTAGSGPQDIAMRAFRDVQRAGKL